jgi:hypothetical protein
MPLDNGHAVAQTSAVPLARIATNDRQLRDMMSDVMEALVAANDPPRLFVRSGELVRLRKDESGAPLTDGVPIAALSARMSEVADFVRTTSNGGATSVMPPREVAGAILALGEWPFPALYGVSDIPIIRPDGTVRTELGYDPETRLIFEPPPGFVMPPISVEPTPDELACAATLIQEAVRDFPFDSPASRANALGLLLTPIVRPLISGPIPLAVIDAPKAGNGKSMLADVTSMIATGRVAGRLVPPTDEEEWRRTITAQLRAAPTIIVLDNLTRPLSSGTLAGALTSDLWEDRRLGASELLRLPQRATWIATGNNVALGGDIPRRCYRIGLDSNLEQPWLRRGFTHDPLIAWVSENRGRLIAAALTIACGWIHAGRPGGVFAALGSFEPWCYIVGGIVVFASEDSFLSNLNDMYARADDDGDRWAGLLQAWLEEFGDAPVTSADVAAWLRRNDSAASILTDDLAESLQASPGFLERRLGNAFRTKEGAIYGRCRIHRAERDRHRGVERWRVTRVSVPADETQARVL